MNKTAKGTRNEKKCEDDLIEAGYTTWRTNRNKYLNLDMFGLFDCCGCSKDGSHMIFVQVKSNRCSKAVKESIREFKMKFFDNPIQMTYRLPAASLNSLATLTQIKGPVGARGVLQHVQTLVTTEVTGAASNVLVGVSGDTDSVIDFTVAV